MVHEMIDINAPQLHICDFLRLHCLYVGKEEMQNILDIR